MHFCNPLLAVFVSLAIHEFLPKNVRAAPRVYRFVEICAGGACIVFRLIKSNRDLTVAS